MMKKFCRYFLSAICAALFVPTALGDSWTDEKMSQIQNMPENPSLKDIMSLCGAAQMIPKNQDDEEVRKLAVKRLLAIPDFKEQLKRHIELERGKWKSGGWVGHYDSIRFRLISSMQKIPDPRVVNMLGKLLKDMEWTSDPIEHIKSRADYSLTPPNGYLAAQSLAVLIEESPVNKSPDNYLDQDVQPWIIWYEKVRSGEKTFSFKGESVEYRFKPDGSWETVGANSPPSSQGLPDQSKKTLPQDVAAPSTPGLKEGIGRWWLWIAGIGIALSVVGFLCFKVCSKVKSN